MTREKIPYATIPHIIQISFAVRHPQEIICSWCHSQIYEESREFSQYKEEALSSLFHP